MRRGRQDPDATYWGEVPLNARVHVRLAELAVERGITVPYGPHKGRANAQAIIRGTGLGQTTIWPLLRHPERLTGIGFETLIRLCKFLQCPIGDLLVLEETVDRPTTAISDEYTADTTPLDTVDGLLR